MSLVDMHSYIQNNAVHNGFWLFFLKKKEKILYNIVIFCLPLGVKQLSLKIILVIISIISSRMKLHTVVLALGIKSMDKFNDS